jgi:hypothetical protein
MELFTQLFSDWVGILSIATIVFILGMAVFIGFYVMRHVHQEEHAPANIGHRRGHRHSH